MLLYVPEYIFPGLRDNLFEHLDGIYNGADTSPSRVQNCGSKWEWDYIYCTNRIIDQYLFEQIQFVALNKWTYEVNLEGGGNRSSNKSKENTR